MNTWRQANPPVRLSLLLIAAGHVLNSTTIVSVSGPLDGGYYPISDATFGGQVAASSWTSSTTYSDVSIDALLTGGVAGTQGIAYLMTRIGPATTVANEVAQGSFSFPLDPITVTLFSGLTLSADTYYLVLASAGPYVAGGWRDAYDACGPKCPTPTVVLDTGVTRNIDFLAGGGSVSVYPPASVFAQGQGIYGDPFVQYSVVAIPEPATFVTLGGGLLALASTFVWRRIVLGRSRFKSRVAKSRVVLVGDSEVDCGGQSPSS